MKVAGDCLPCSLRSCQRLLDGLDPAPAVREDLLRRTLSHLAAADFEQSPPALARGLHRLYREVLDDPDPYAEIKRAGNAMMEARRDGFRARIREAADPLGTAVRLAVAANVIDFGAKNLFDPDEAFAAVLDRGLDVDDTATLRRELTAAHTVLYVCDNAGEIVVDALLAETLDHPGLVFVVRGSPVLNDATVDDACAVGLDRLGRVITTGDDAPGAILEAGSEEFRTAFASADVVLSKGQGNLEGLIEADRAVYFLLTAKCDLVAARLGVHVGAKLAWRKPSGAWTGPAA